MATRQIVYSYDSVPTVERFSKADTFKRLILGPFGSGKSSGCIMEMVQRGMRQAPSPLDGVRRTRWAVVRNSYPQLRDTTIKSVQDWFPPKLFGTWKITDNDYTINKLVAPDGSPVEITMMFRALDKPEHVANLLSMEITGAWFNEVREIPKVIVDAMDGRVGRFPSGREGRATWHGIIMDSNPPDTDSWIYRIFEEDKPSNCQVFKQPSGLSLEAENLPNLPINYYQNMAIGKDTEFIKVYIHGEYGFVQDGKSVYPNFKDSIHVAKEDLKPLKGVPLIVGFDFGLTPAAVILQFTPKGKVHILEEFTTTSMSIRELARNVVKPVLMTKYSNYEVIAKADPAGKQRAQTDEKTCFQELRDAGIAAVPSVTNSLVARIAAVDHFLRQIVGGEPAFQLSPCCKMLRKAFNGEYRYRRLKVSGDERYVDTPEKNEASHISDALQYAMMEADYQASGTGRAAARYTPQKRPDYQAFY